MIKLKRNPIDHCSKIYLQKRLADFLWKDPTTNCWRWLGTVVNKYGQISIGDKGYKVNRVSLYAYTDDFNINDQEQYANHIVTCPHKDCFNPEHLYKGTASQNTKDSITTKTHYYANQTHCKHGHEFTKENTFVNYKGFRFCRACKKQREFKYKVDNNEND